MGVKRKDRRFVQHNACYFGINHWTRAGCHQLYMLDVAFEENPSEQSVPDEEAMSMSDGPVQHEEMRSILKRRRPQYFDKQQQLELVLAAQELSKFGDHELDPTGSDDEEDHGVKSSSVDIWEDTDCLALLKEGVLPTAVNIEEGKRIKKGQAPIAGRSRNFSLKSYWCPNLRRGCLW
jgi:hypothetical protein